MARTTPAMTLEEYQKLLDDGFLHELSNGMLVREPRPGARHGYVATNVIRKLDAYVRERDLGSVFTETGYLLKEEPETIRGPDVSFIAKDRLPAEIPAGFWPFAPDLAIEILSPSNSASETERKVLEYLDAGTRMVWVIDPDTRTARSYRGNEALLVREEGELSAAEVVSGFSLRLSDVL